MVIVGTGVCGVRGDEVGKFADTIVVVRQYLGMNEAVTQIRSPNLGFECLKFFDDLALGGCDLFVLKWICHMWVSWQT